MEATDRATAAGVPDGVQGISSGDLAAAQEEAGSTPSFALIDRIARALCEKTHGHGSWDAPHRKRASYHSAAHRLVRNAGIGSLARLYERFGLKAMLP